MNHKQIIGFVGTYTKGASEGIYSFLLDIENQKIDAVKTAAKLDNPTYLTISRDNQFVYAVAKKDELGGISAFTLNKQTGDLTLLNSQFAVGAPPCHVSVDRQTQTVLSANYHKGTIEAYEVDKETGEIYGEPVVAQHEGAGPDPRQEKAHAHFAGFTPDEKYIVAVDLGIDEVITYELNGGSLTKVSSLAVKPGSGPRHLVFHPNGKFAYVMTEFSSKVLVLNYDSENGQLTEEQAITTIPADFTENNQGSAIHISSDGRFLYAGNRGHDSIAVFSIDQQSNKLTFIEHTSTAGNWPRDFVLDPSEKFIIAANQESSNLALFARDTETGKLTLLQSDVTVPDPVCVKFMHI
ncbi:lactonase family protein [Neobacillus sp. LXY-4]|uniref:lactonase family protein n=1 Tax=Neobacillus sp. LXY-4 TaxID=3379826 RepID=UPI003EE23346